MKSILLSFIYHLINKFRSTLIPFLVSVLKKWNQSCYSLFFSMTQRTFSPCICRARDISSVLHRRAPHTRYYYYELTTSRSSHIHVYTINKAISFLSQFNWIHIHWTRRTHFTGKNTVPEKKKELLNMLINILLRLFW